MTVHATFSAAMPMAFDAPSAAAPVSRSRCVARFPADTPIATPNGEIPLGQLGQGATVLSACGFAFITIRPVAARPVAMLHLPAGSIAPRTPISDLRLAPDHMVALRLPGEAPRRPLSKRALSVLVSAEAVTTDIAMIEVESPSPLVVYLAGLPVWIDKAPDRR